MDAWEMVRDERIELADLLDTLTPEQWDTPTLCAGWRVRDVTAHLIEAATLPKSYYFKAAVRTGFRINTMLDREARRLGASPPAELASSLRETAGSHNLPPGVKPIHLVMDVFVHTQDIRRPLGRLTTAPEARLRAVADDLLTNPGMGVKKRVAGLHLRATDIDWSHGAGAEVTGPAEALIMAMSARPAALDDLSGDGVATLRSRVGA
jgi:uncharacterized protein (TIGR03083 family)